MATVICPVCQMQIDSGEAAGRLEYEGNTYYLCSQNCLDLFSADPGQYV